MTDILNTGKSALFAFQRALSTTSHNIANVNTEGYSRQRVDLEAVAGDPRNTLNVGAGVRIAGIQRIHDQFATSRVISANSAHAAQETNHAMASRIDNLVASESVSVASALDEFFSALQDTNLDPSSVSSREVVLDRAEQLAGRFRTLQEQFDDAQTEVNNRTRAAVATVGELAQSIADINNQVVGLQGKGASQSANDLMDQRDQLVKRLSGYIDIDTVVQDNGAMNVFMGKGVSLVIDSGAQRIQTVADDTYPDRVQIQIGREGFEKNLSARLQGGEIGGLNEFASKTLHPAMNELGRLALKMSDSMNNQHTQGLDINGDPGGSLFASAQPQVFSSRSNTGSGVVSAQVRDSGAIEASDYLLRFDGANFTATRNSDGQQSTVTLPVTLDGLSVTLSGTPVAGDTFVVSATGRAAGSMESLVTDPEALALSGQLSTVSNIGNVGESRISAASVINPESFSLRDPVDIVFTSDSAYDVIDVNSGGILAAGVSYAEDDPITFNGWEVSISGAAREGDTHRIEANTNGRGNSSNGLSLVELQMDNTIDGTQTFNDAYGSLVSRVGAQTYSAKTRADALETLRDSAVDRQQASQGVSLDEEAIDITRYQQAYQAAAQIIATADELFQSILGAVR